MEMHNEDKIRRMRELRHLFWENVIEQRFIREEAERKINVLQVNVNTITSEFEALKQETGSAMTFEGNNKKLRSV